MKTTNEIREETNKTNRKLLFDLGIIFTDLKLVNLEGLLDYVDKENERQIKKWGIQTHNSAEWNIILNEEIGELTKEMLEIHFGDWEKARKHYETAFKEAIQVSTLALKIAEMLDNLINKNNENNEM